MTSISVVVPTIGRPSLARLLGSLRPQLTAQSDVELVVVDDRPVADSRLPVPPEARLLRRGGAGPAAARNTGWQAARGDWIAFLDDDVVPAADWLTALRADLAAVAPDVGGVQGRLDVPAAPGRPDDQQRETETLATADWITADMAYRRQALTEAGGFDERFPRAYREDVELAHRVRRAGWTLRRGGRRVTHPARPDGPWASVRRQRGNADDALLRRLYGPGWHRVLDVPRGRRRAHAAVTALAVTALAAALANAVAGRRAPLSLTARVAALAWLAGTVQFAAHRARRAPGSLRHPVALAATSAAIPPAAVGAWWRGWWQHRHSRPWSGSMP